MKKENPLSEPQTYEEQLDADSDWALREGSLFFEDRGKVQYTLRKLALKLDELRIPYAVVGGMALYQHGYRRFTEDVDVLITREDLKTLHEKLHGLGYIPPFKGSKQLRDAETGVKIEFIISGEFPGDGKPKPVAFPAPEEVSQRIDGISFVNLPKLIELKLASGMSNLDRMRDIADVLELIKSLRLKAAYAEQLDPYVRTKYLELCNISRRRYFRTWADKLLTSEVKSIDDMMAVLPEAAQELRAMKRDGVQLDEHAGRAGCVSLVTDDPEVAAKYDMHDEGEFWNEAGE